MPNFTENVGVLVLLEAKPERAQEVESFLSAALSLAQREPNTLRWYALRLGATRFGVFDTFADDPGRNEHFAGEIARQLFAQAEVLFAQPPQVERVDVLAHK